MKDGKTPGQRMNLVDRFVSFINPEAGLKRMAARNILHEFSSTDHLRGSSGGMARNAASEAFNKQRDRYKEMWDARELAERDWIGGTLGRIVLYTCGELENKANTGDTEVDKLYNEYFHDWCGDEEDDDGYHRCDLTGRHRFLKMLQMGFLAMFVDGDHGFVPVVHDNDIKLQMIEADRIGSPLEAQQNENYIGGFTIDPETGRPVSVRLFKRTRMGQYVQPVEIEPANFFHLWDPDRGDQYRGRTYLRRLLGHSRDIREWVEAEKYAGKTQSQFAGVIGSKDPYAKSGVAAWESKTAAGTPSQAAEWGKLLKMAEGETFSLIAPPSRPSGGFLAFVQMVIRMMAISLDLPYGFVWDLATLGGVTARIEVRQAERRIRYWQRLLVDRVLRRTRRMVLARGISLGDLPAHPNWRKCDWHFGPWIITDVGYEAQNDLAMLTAGIVPVTAVAAKYNADPLETGLANASVINGLQSIAAEKGVPIEMLAGGWLPNASQMLAAMNSEPAAAPEPGSLEAVGEKGAAQIVDLLSKVATGQMERDAAIQTLVTVYGLDRARAEGIMPAEGVKREAGGDGGGDEEAES